MQRRGSVESRFRNAFIRQAILVVRYTTLVFAVATWFVAGNVAHADDARSEARVTSEVSDGERAALRTRRLELLRAFAEQITQERERRQASQPRYRRDPPPRPPSLTEQPR